MPNPYHRQDNGLRELKDSIQQLVFMLSEDDVKESFLAIANDMKNEMQARIHDVTGNLSRGIHAELFKNEGKCISFVAVDFKIAPHAYLVERGHANVNGSTTPGHPFFAPVCARYRGMKYKELVEEVLRAKLSGMKFGKITKVTLNVNR